LICCISVYTVTFYVYVLGWIWFVGYIRFAFRFGCYHHRSVTFTFTFTFGWLVGWLRLRWLRLVHTYTRFTFGCHVSHTVCTVAHGCSHTHTVGFVTLHVRLFTYTRCVTLRLRLRLHTAFTVYLVPHVWLFGYGSVTVPVTFRSRLHVYVRLLHGYILRYSSTTFYVYWLPHTFGWFTHTHPTRSFRLVGYVPRFTTHAHTRLLRWVLTLVGSVYTTLVTLLVTHTFTHVGLLRLPFTFWLRLRLFGSGCGLRFTFIRLLVTFVRLLLFAFYVTGFDFRSRSVGLLGWFGSRLPVAVVGYGCWFTFVTFAVVDLRLFWLVGYGCAPRSVRFGLRLRLHVCWFTGCVWVAVCSSRLRYTHVCGYVWLVYRTRLRLRLFTRTPRCILRFARLRLHVYVLHVYGLRLRLRHTFGSRFTHHYTTRVPVCVCRLHTVHAFTHCSHARSGWVFYAAALHVTAHCTFTHCVTHHLHTTHCTGFTHAHAHGFAHVARTTWVWFTHITYTHGLPFTHAVLPFHTLHTPHHLRFPAFGLHVGSRLVRFGCGWWFTIYGSLRCLVTHVLRLVGCVWLFTFTFNFGWLQFTVPHVGYVTHVLPRLRFVSVGSVCYVYTPVYGWLFTFGFHYTHGLPVVTVHGYVGLLRLRLRLPHVWFTLRCYVCVWLRSRSHVPHLRYVWLPHFTLRYVTHTFHTVTYTVTHGLPHTTHVRLVVVGLRLRFTRLHVTFGFTRFTFGLRLHYTTHTLHTGLVTVVTFTGLFTVYVYTFGYVPILRLLFALFWLVPIYVWLVVYVHTTFWFAFGLRGLRFTVYNTPTHTRLRFTVTHTVWLHTHHWFVYTRLRFVTFTRLVYTRYVYCGWLHTHVPFAFTLHGSVGWITGYGCHILRFGSHVLHTVTFTVVHLVTVYHRYVILRLVRLVTLHGLRFTVVCYVFCTFYTVRLFTVTHVHVLHTHAHRTPLHTFAGCLWFTHVCSTVHTTCVHCTHSFYGCVTLVTSVTGFTLHTLPHRLRLVGSRCRLLHAHAVWFGWFVYVYVGLHLVWLVRLLVGSLHVRLDFRLFTLVTLHARLHFTRVYLPPHHVYTRHTRSYGWLVRLRCLRLRSRCVCVTRLHVHTVAYLVGLVCWLFFTTHTFTFHDGTHTAHVYVYGSRLRFTYTPHVCCTFTTLPTVHSSTHHTHLPHGFWLPPRTTFCTFHTRLTHVYTFRYGSHGFTRLLLVHVWLRLHPRLPRTPRLRFAGFV